MNLPRYRVKTLLIATTIAAVLVACLAPWLRLLSASQVGICASRLLCIALGVGIGRLSQRWRYWRLYDSHATSKPVFHVQSVYIGTTTWVPVLLLGIYLTLGLVHDLGRPASARSFTLDCLLWGVLGSLIPRNLPRLFSWEPAALITDTWLVHPFYSMRWNSWTRWHKGTPYRWLDREAGILEVKMTSPCPLVLRVRPEDIDAVDEFLSRKLSDNDSSPS